LKHFVSVHFKAPMPNAGVQACSSYRNYFKKLLTRKSRLKELVAMILMMIWLLGKTRTTRMRTWTCLRIPQLKCSLQCCPR